MAVGGVADAPGVLAPGLSDMGRLGAVVDVTGVVRRRLYWRDGVEPGGLASDQVQAVLADSAMSTVNLAEVVGQFARHADATRKQVTAVLSPLPIDDRRTKAGNGRLRPTSQHRRSPGSEQFDSVLMVWAKPRFEPSGYGAAEETQPMKLYTDRFAQIHVTEEDAPSDWRLVATSRPCPQPDSSLPGEACPAPCAIADVPMTAEWRHDAQHIVVERPSDSSAKSLGV